MLLPPGTFLAGSFEAAAVNAAWAGWYGKAEAALARAHHPSLIAWLPLYIAAARGALSQAAREGGALAHLMEPRPLRVATALTAAASHRQLGRYTEARRLDLLALRNAVHPWERANALVGLAADSIGDADPAQAAIMLTRAEQVAGAGPRATIRAAWVRCELDLLRARPVDAVGGARVALHHATASGARRHIAKSTLFLGVALDAANDPEAGRTLAHAERLSAAVGARALTAVARDLLARGRRDRIRNEAPG